MKPRRQSIIVSMFAVIVAAGCSGGSTAPTPTQAPTQPTPVLGINFRQVVNGYECQAMLFTGNGQSRDVTGLSSWSTSDATIATANSVGFVTVYRKGDVAVRARYQDLDAFVTIQGVVPGGLSYYYRSLSGTVRDGQNNKLPGATVLILDGANSGRTTTVRTDGAYEMDELQPGTFTVRFSFAGYGTTDLGFTLPGDKLVSLDATLPRSQ